VLRYKPGSLFVHHLSNKSAPEATGSLGANSSDQALKIGLPGSSQVCIKG
jgi:hypothetical protein